MLRISSIFLLVFFFLNHMSSVTHESCRWYYLFWCLESQRQTCLCQKIDTRLVLARSTVGERTSLNRYLKCGQALKSDSQKRHCGFPYLFSLNNFQKQSAEFTNLKVICWAVTSPGSMAGLNTPPIPCASSIITANKDSTTGNWLTRCWWMHEAE